MNAQTTWVHADRIEEVTVSSEAQSWLLEKGSITARLKNAWPDTRVAVLNEGLQTPNATECLRLALQPSEPCWVREVQLLAAELPLVHARTVIPQWSRGNPWRELSSLGQRPLGELLFHLPGLLRSPMEFALGTQPARRCTYTREGAVLLLTEAFDFLDRTAATRSPVNPAPSPPPQ